MAVVCLLLQSFASAGQTEIERQFAAAQVQMLSGGYVGARDNFASVWKEFAATLGESSLVTIEARIFYGQALTMTGKPDEALTILGPISLGNSRTAMIARGSFALALRQSGQMDRAVGLLKELVRIFPNAEPSDLVHLGRLHAELAVCQAYRNRLKEAEAHAFESLKLIDAGGNPISAELRSTSSLGRSI